MNALVGSRTRDPVYNFCAVELLRLVTSDDVMTTLLKKLAISIKIHLVKPLWSLFSQLPNCRPNPPAVVVTRELGLIANSVHTADADATQLDSSVASAVCIGH